MSKHKTTVAAVDLGATSGRVIVGLYSQDGLEMTEVHRFPNSFRHLGNHDYWDVGMLFAEVKQGLLKARKLFPDLRSIGIDTWGCDFALVDRTGRLVFPVHAYRDSRCEGILAEMQSSGMDRQMHALTGLPAINYNSGLQMRETVGAFPALMEMADRALFLPEYFNFLLSGVMANEISIASTTQLLEVEGEGFSKPAMEYFGVPPHWLQGPMKAGSVLGPVQGVEGLEGVSVVLVPGHDTSCAFEAIPRSGEDLFVSSGTWLLVGARTPKPLLGEEAFLASISNERCGDGAYRPCRILIGLWLLEQILPAFEERPTNEAEWAALIQAAEEMPEPPTLLKTEDRARLFNPVSMKEAIDAQIRERGAQPPASLPGYVRLICESLAASVASAASQFEALGKVRFDNLVIVGGGSKNRLLCQALADRVGVRVTAYNLEATSVGNMGYQLKALGVIPDLAHFHRTLLSGLQGQSYRPSGRDRASPREPQS